MQIAARKSPFGVHRSGNLHPRPAGLPASRFARDRVVEPEGADAAHG